MTSYDEAEAKLLSCKNSRLKAQYAEGIINPIVLAEAVGIRPQMIYNYIRSGKIQTLEESASAGITTNNTQHIVISWDVAVEWARKYFEKKERIQERIEAELRGETVSWRSQV